MSEKSVAALVKQITPQSTDDEKIKALGVFRKVPSVSAMMLTRGLARFYSSKFYAAVTNDRIILSPVSGKKGQSNHEPIISVSFDDVRFYEKFLYATVMEVRLPGEEPSLKLRFSEQMHSLNLDKFEFVGAVYQGKSR